MQHCDYLILADHAVTMDPACMVLHSASIAISDGIIKAVGPEAELSAQYRPDRVIGGKDRLVMPGLVNAHTHAPMVLMRGLADDMPLLQWLENHIWPAENRWLSEEFVRDAARLACLEMVRSGTTAFCDMYFFEGIVAEVASEMGLRAVLTAGIIDMPTQTTSGADDCIEKARSNISKFTDKPLITPGIGLHSTYTCSPETIKKCVTLALEHDVLLSVHLSETEWEVNEVNSRYGASPVLHLDSLGFFAARTINSHAVWVSPDEMELMASRGAHIAHCPESNLKLASGVAPVPAMLKAGLNVCIGTDGAASNNDLDMLAEMATAARLHKGVWKDPSAVDSPTALAMATVNGAKALGLEGVGAIKSGAVADLVVLDMRKPHLTPMFNPLSHLVYSARCSDVESVMVNGRLLLDGGRLTVGDEEDIIDRASAWGRRIMEES